MSTKADPGPDRDVVIRATDVRVRLGGALILPHVDLTVHEGEVVALMGANGSGKSTLVRALVGVVPLEGGTVDLFGRPLGRTVPWRRLGYVPQRMSAGGGVPASACEVVIAGTLDRRHLRPPRDARRRACAALDRVGLADHADRPARELSGGQQQRVLIARALVREPDLLVLDEPVAGVDLPSQDAFASALTTLVAENTTVLVVLHELGALAPLVRRAVVLRHGTVVHDGAPPAARQEHAGPDHVHVHPHDDAGASDVTGVAPAVRWGG